jgi:hypothetical protein
MEENSSTHVGNSSHQGSPDFDAENISQVQVSPAGQGTAQTSDKLVSASTQLRFVQGDSEGEGYDQSTKTMHVKTGKTDFRGVMYISFLAWADGLKIQHKTTLAKHFGPIGSNEWYHGSAAAFQEYSDGDLGSANPFKRLFEQVSTAIAKLRGQQKGQQKGLHPEVRQVFDEMLGRRSSSG